MRFLSVTKTNMVLGNKLYRTIFDVFLKSVSNKLKYFKFALCLLISDLWLVDNAKDENQSDVRIDELLLVFSKPTLSFGVEIKLIYETTAFTVFFMIFCFISSIGAKV